MDQTHTPRRQLLLMVVALAAVVALVAAVSSWAAASPSSEAPAQYQAQPAQGGGSALPAQDGADGQAPQAQYAPSAQQPGGQRPQDCPEGSNGGAYGGGSGGSGQSESQSQPTAPSTSPEV